MNEQQQPPTNAVSTIAGALAAMVLEERLRNGGTVEIPSLGIVITKDNVKEPKPKDTQL